MELTLFGGAFLAGVLSFLSPCVLPLLPTFSLILAKNSQQDGREAQRLYVNTAAFLAGFTVVFVLLGATASLLGAWLFSYQEILRQGAALLVILMGLFMTGWLRIPLLLREYRPFQRRGFDGVGGAFLLGCGLRRSCSMQAVQRPSAQGRFCSSSTAWALPYRFSSSL